MADSEIIECMMAESGWVGGVWFADDGCGEVSNTRFPVRFEFVTLYGCGVGIPFHPVRCRGRAVMTDVLVRGLVKGLNV